MITGAVVKNLYDRFLRLPGATICMWLSLHYYYCTQNSTPSSDSRSSTKSLHYYNCTQNRGSDSQSTIVHEIVHQTWSLWNKYGSGHAERTTAVLHVATVRNK